MTKRWMMALPLAALAACGGEAPKNETAATKQAAFPAGEWEVTTLVESFRSADKTTPAVSKTAGASETRKLCVKADGGKPDRELFVLAGDDCKPSTEYAKNGRMNIAYQCQRPGRGLVSTTVDGNFTADSFEARAATATTFPGDGDYVLSEKVTGKRLGDCPAG